MSEPLTAAQRVAIARHPQRPNITDYIQALFTDFFEQKGDRLCGEDAAILGGVALYHGRPVTVIGTRKGKTLEENLKCNFGMPNPEGYRKALRLMRQAEKFRRPILTFIDTSGAYPGLEAEAHGQGEAIARNLYEMSRLTVPVIALITGEGNSGGALALGVANRVLMLENSVYAILSPEGFASILWKDSARHEEACELMKLTAPDLLELGVIDGIIPEPEGGAHLAPAAHMRQVDRALSRCLAELSKESGAALAAGRDQKFRRMGAAPQKEEALAESKSEAPAGSPLRKSSPTTTWQKSWIPATSGSPPAPASRPATTAPRRPTRICAWAPPGRRWKTPGFPRRTSAPAWWPLSPPTTCPPLPPAWCSGGWGCPTTRCALT